MLKHWIQLVKGLREESKNVGVPPFCLNNKLGPWDHRVTAFLKQEPGRFFSLLTVRPQPIAPYPRHCVLDCCVFARLLAGLSWFLFYLSVKFRWVRKTQKIYFQWSDNAQKGKMWKPHGMLVTKKIYAWTSSVFFFLIIFWKHRT